MLHKHSACGVSSARGSAQFSLCFNGMLADPADVMCSNAAQFCLGSLYPSHVRLLVLQTEGCLDKVWVIQILSQRIRAATLLAVGPRNRITVYLRQSKALV
jgi:hypothetical protein